MTKAEAIAQLPQSHNVASEALGLLTMLAVCGFAVWYATGWLSCYLSDRALRRKIRVRAWR